MAPSDSAPLARTPLHALHVALGARMVPFAGYEMPVQFPTGVLKEHLHTRRAAGLFDVSHMGQLRLAGVDAAAALERLTPMDIVGLGAGQQRYALFTDDAGGILDDLMVTNAGDHLLVVVNAACKVQDTAHLRAELGGPGGPDCEIVELDARALLALQGPVAADVMRRLCPAVDLATWTFMSGRDVEIAGIPCFATRSGYTGEDGFEISVDADRAGHVADVLCGCPEVAPVGLGARDSLRLEAGLCLYGNDIDRSTTPVEAGLAWSISKVRRADGARAAGFPGADRILAQLAAGKDPHAPGGATRRRVGLVGRDRTPVREHATLVDGTGDAIGEVTSGTFGPTAERAVAMGYVPLERTTVGDEISALVRGKAVPMHVAPLPFVPHRYYRG